MRTAPAGLIVRPGAIHWEILCPPGPLATFLHQLSQDAGPIQTEWIEGKYLNVIPYTSSLDGALMTLIDDLIDLRYATGRVQLQLFDPKGF